MNINNEFNNFITNNALTKAITPTFADGAREVTTVRTLANTPGVVSFQL